MMARAGCRHELVRTFNSSVSKKHPYPVDTIFALLAVSALFAYGFATRFSSAG